MYRPETSAAGFFDLKDSGRQVYDFNVGWRFLKGDAEGAGAADYDDSGWTVVSVPHTPELVPAEGSGGRNYQGPVWYRKHFTLPEGSEGQRVTVYFEAVMGKAEVYVNGKRVREHVGGYLPFSVDLTTLGLKPGEKAVIAVRADNSDDKTYPPGKPQRTLDFAYHGGIYRDVWLIATAPVYVTDPNEAGQAAGGGVFVHCDNITGEQADVYVDTDVKNDSPVRQTVGVETELCDAAGNPVGWASGRVVLRPGESRQVKQKITVRNPRLWSPDDPYLYRVNTRLRGAKGDAFDGGTTRVGIRKVEFRGKDGLWLNGKPFGQIIGTNRHQDFAYVGNAVPNSRHWQDVKLLREAGCRIIRSAHYPQDPAFMDACDELGIFMIVPTPGWQYWNKDTIFADRVYDDIRHMMRRDRNHPSVILWEPVLNETPYPLEFATRALEITKEEYPYPGRFAVGDNHSAGVARNYEVVYGWPADEGKFRQNIFTREFGENVDDWYAQNNNNRASRSWGERPQIVQALKLGRAYDAMYQTTGQFIGGAQWHAFDHQRGYHPDPYWGGLTDAFRQPKYAYYLFQSQVPPDLKLPLAETGPMVFVAHEMTPYSDTSVVVFSNCDSVRLIVFERDTLVRPVVKGGKTTMPYRPVIFPDAFVFDSMRVHTYIEKNWKQANIVAEGIIRGKVVCSTRKMPSRRSTRLQLRLADTVQPLTADGSDFTVVVAEMTDDEGNVRRLAKDKVLFTVEGGGEIIGGPEIGANPRDLEFGSAPVLIRSTTKPGKIRVTARILFEGYHTAHPVSLEFESAAPQRSMVYDERPQVTNRGDDRLGRAFFHTKSEEEKRKEVQRVGQQQVEFGEKFQ